MSARRAAWIAADLIQEMRQRPVVLAASMLVSGIVYPLLMGMTDGGLSRGPFPMVADAGVRLCLTAQLAGPALPGFALLIEILHARRMKGELEPLLASPVTGAELVAGLALAAGAPAALCMPAAFGAAELGRAVTGGSGGIDLAADSVVYGLACAAAAVWLTAFGIAAGLKARSVAELSLRVGPVFVVLPAIDGVGLLLTSLGAPGAIPPMLILALLAGAAALAVVALRLDREDAAGRI